MTIGMLPACRCQCSHTATNGNADRRTNLPETPVTPATLHTTTKYNGTKPVPAEINRQALRAFDELLATIGRKLQLSLATKDWRATLAVIHDAARWQQVRTRYRADSGSLTYSWH
ncbi:hypothetical protein GCM10023114_37760 [Mycolicibacterium sediminis]|uniref:Uncharacterized protein n=1 Tax=Mycolicibacterium sediminis TaxID=1286180 RepID=A0A7I7QW52_9MYCO|nr:hypothetical protein MSEDJ_47150 [Mycolicibacterium sediminis]